MTTVIIVIAAAWFFGTGAAAVLTPYKPKNRPSDPLTPEELIEVARQFREDLEREERRAG